MWRWRIMTALAVCAVLALVPGTSHAETHYTESEAIDLYSAAGYFGDDIDLFHQRAAAVHHFLLGVSGKLTNPIGGCEQRYDLRIDARRGPYTFTSMHPDPIPLATVARYYCLTPDQAQKANASLLAFLTGVDASRRGTQVRRVTPPAPPVPSAIPAGVALVGTDVAPGTYRSIATGFCYVARLSGLGGDFDDIISNALRSAGEQAFVVIRPTDTAIDNDADCGPWQPVDIATASPLRPGLLVPPGVALVGVDIAPGTYRSVATGSCYVARLAGLDDTISDIISNANYSAGEQVIVEIADDDLAVETDADCGTWQRID